MHCYVTSYVLKINNLNLINRQWTDRKTKSGIAKIYTHHHHHGNINNGVPVIKHVGDVNKMVISSKMARISKI